MSVGALWGSETPLIINVSPILSHDIAATLMGEVRLCKISDSSKAVNEAFAMCKEEFGKCRKYEVVKCNIKPFINHFTLFDQ